MSRCSAGVAEPGCVRIAAISRCGLRGGSVRDPGPETLDLLGRPRAVAGHVSVGEATEDGVLVLNDVLVCPEVEVSEHRAAVAFPEERFDVGCVTGHRGRS